MEEEEDLILCSPDVCDHCIYIGEGDSICDIEDPKIVLDDWEPTDDYFWCGGSCFVKKFEDN